MHNVPYQTDHVKKGIAWVMKNHVYTVFNRQLVVL